MKSIITISITILLCQRLMAQLPGDAIFSANTLIHEVRITLPMENWFDTLSNQYELGEIAGENFYTPGTLEFNGILLENVGFKFKGNSSYNNPGVKKSWKISTEEFVSGNELDGINELNLNNGFKDPSFYGKNYLSIF